LLGNSAVQVLRYWRDDVVISNPKLAVQSDRVWMGLTTYEKDDDRWGDAWCPEPSIIDDAGETLWSAEACGVLQGLFTLEDEVLLALIAPPTSQQGDPFRLVRVSTN